MSAIEQPAAGLYRAAGLGSRLGPRRVRRSPLSPMPLGRGSPTVANGPCQLDSNFFNFIIYLSQIIFF